MKLLTLFTIFCAGAVCAQEPGIPPGFAAAPPPKVFKNAAQVRVDVLMVELPESKALPLIPQLRDPKTVAETQQKVLAMVAAKDARFLDWPEVTIRDGERGVSETIREQRYPVEFEQPQVPQSMGGVKREITPAEKALHQLRALGLIVPNTFETRNTGSTLEVECAIAPDFSAVELHLAPQHVEWLRMEEHPAGKDEKGEPVSVKQPLFQTVQTRTVLNLRDGERRLLYIGKPKDPGGTIVFFLIGAHIDPPIK